jgi:hypothetical protein
MPVFTFIVFPPYGSVAMLPVIKSTQAALVKCDSVNSFNSVRNAPAVPISLLKDRTHLCNENYTGFTFPGFNGNTIPV